MLSSPPAAGAGGSSGGAGAGNPLPLAAQLARLEEAHRGGVSAASLDAPLDAPGLAPPDGVSGGAGAGAGAPALPPRAPRAPRALRNAARAAEAAAGGGGGGGFAGDDDFDPSSDGTPRGRRACTTSVLAPCARVNGNVATLYRCGGCGGGGARGSVAARTWPWLCQWGPDWPCNLATFALVLGPTVPFQVLVAWRISIAVSIAGVLIALAALITLALTALSDPGYLVKQSKAQLEAQRRGMEEQGLTGTFTCCQFCNTIRAPRTSHCYDCNACVLELDHHCPWMGKCVGKYNLMYFYSFLWSICALFLFTAAAFFTWLINKPRE